MAIYHSRLVRFFHSRGQFLQVIIFGVCVGVGRLLVAMAWLMDEWMDCMNRGWGRSSRNRVAPAPLFLFTHPNIHRLPLTHQPTHQAYEASRRAKQLALFGIILGTTMLAVYYFTMRRQARRSA